RRGAATGIAAAAGSDLDPVLAVERNEVAQTLLIEQVETVLPDDQRVDAAGDVLDADAIAMRGSGSDPVVRDGVLNPATADVLEVGRVVLETREPDSIERITVDAVVAHVGEQNGVEFRPQVNAIDAI